MTSLLLLYALVADAAAPPPVAPAPAAQDAVRLPVTRQTLSNGLEVLLHEDHTLPMVAVNLWYHVGSKNEHPGQTGFAHLFEHLMFQGSGHFDDEYFKPLQRLGAEINGSTNSDRTNYFEVLPSEHLELALWMEADRMGFLLDALTQAKLDNQRDVVKNERRQRYENQPYGEVAVKLYAAMYPDTHPYHWLTIGSQADLTAASLDDVKKFFDRFYRPKNASLALAGDFDPKAVLPVLERTFGTIGAGEPASKVQPPPVTLAKEVRLQMEDRVKLARLYIAWHSPAFFADGDADLDVLANVLTSGKSSRLWQRLVYQDQIAQDVSASQNSAELGSLFQLTLTAAPGHTLAELEKAAYEELDKLRAEAPSEREVQRSINGWESMYLWSLEGLNSRADAVNRYLFYKGTPDYLQADLERYRHTTPASVQKWAKAVLEQPGRVVIEVTPVKSQEAK